MSPYGNTKQIEKKITDTAKVTNINAILLRYFNPIEAHSSTEMENYLLVFSKFSAVYYTNRFWIAKNFRFGDDYPTPDGTAVRDYIHVVDLAKALLLLSATLIEQKKDKVEP
jgi:UDP-glucose 4-epimerase